MKPTRMQTVNGHVVREFLLDTKRIVTVDNKTTIETFAQACERLEKERKKA